MISIQKQRTQKDIESMNSKSSFLKSESEIGDTIKASEIDQNEISFDIKEIIMHDGLEEQISYKS